MSGGVDHSRYPALTRNYIRDPDRFYSDVTAAVRRGDSDEVHYALLMTASHSLALNKMPELRAPMTAAAQKHLPAIVDGVLSLAHDDGALPTAKVAEEAGTVLTNSLSHLLNRGALLPPAARPAILRLFAAVALTPALREAPGAAAASQEASLKYLRDRATFPAWGACEMLIPERLPVTEDAAQAYMASIARDAVAGMGPCGRSVGLLLGLRRLGGLAASDFPLSHRPAHIAALTKQIARAFEASLTAGAAPLAAAVAAGVVDPSSPNVAALRAVAAGRDASAGKTGAAVGGAAARPRALLGACVVCGSAGDKMCGRCKTATYCSEACQKNHWKSGGHKAVCAAPADMKAPAATKALPPDA